MLKNHLRVALRNLRRHPGYSAINVGGLALGMAACLLIGLYVRDELRVDTFHAHADRLYVLGMESAFRGPDLVTPYPLAATLEAEVPEVERAVRTQGGGEVELFHAPTRTRLARRLLFADPAFFEVFSFPLLEGEAASALATPEGLVLTAETARQFFGDADPVGQVLTVERFGATHALTVTAVAADPPAPSTIQFDAVASMGVLPAAFTTENGWNASMYDTYALLERPMPAAELSAKVAAAVRPHLTGENPPAVFALPLPERYLSGYDTADGFRGQTRYLYLFGSVALLVLLIAAFNYVNLVTAQAGVRAREVGVRKALGAGRGELARQFLTESVLASGAALALAVGLAALALPAFNALFGTSIEWAASRGPLAALAGVVLLVGVAAGAYPALVLSRFQPVRVLRAASATTAGGGGWLRRGLVVAQFAITSALILGTVVVYQQLHYVQAKNLGFDGEQVLVVELPGEDTQALAEALREDVLRHPGVQAASVADAVPGRFNVQFGRPPASTSSEAVSDEEVVFFNPSKVDAHYVEALGLELLAGRSFSEDLATDRTEAYVLNHTAAASLGWTPEEAVGKPFALEEGADGQVIGVVEDFHTESLHRAIGGVVMVMESESFSSSGGLLVARLAPDRIREAVGFIEAQVERRVPDRPFTYAFLDDDFDAMYEAEVRLGQVFTAFAGLAVLIACLGLFGLAAFTTAQRTREIGIRKTLGATVGQIVGLLSRDFALLVGVALVIGAPVAYYGMARWLEDFAYRVAIGPATFALTAALALAIAGLSVGYQALKAAVADPVKALRHE